MKLLVISLFMFLGINHSIAANTITCKARVLTSVCGTGKIEVELDLDKQSFELTHGDVMCWFSEFHTNGTLTRINSPHHLVNVTSYKLENKEEKLGEITVRKTHDDYYPSLARVNFIQNSTFISQGANIDRYNLDCTN